jgi:dolichol-phosphate mannosyltransferase
MHAVIVIPTYNERKNICQLLAILDEEYVSKSNGLRWSIVIVDDQSPDGTAEEVEAYAAHCPAVFLSSGSRCGLGAAYRRGFHYALTTLDADVVIQMDADFSHPPQEITNLVEAVRNGADLVIGSRYCAGGSTEAAWGFFRHCISRMGNMAAKISFALPTDDCTSGFRAFWGDFLRSLPYLEGRLDGYVFQVGMVHEALQAEGSVREMPIHFRKREAGVSKLRFQDVTEFAGYCIQGLIGVNSRRGKNDLAENPNSL